MATGESWAAFDMDWLLKAVRQCGDSVTIKLQGEGKAALIEGTGYWQVFMPLSGFPSEVAFSQAERKPWSGWRRCYAPSAGARSRL